MLLNLLNKTFCRLNVLCVNFFNMSLLFDLLDMFNLLNILFLDMISFLNSSPRFLYLVKILFSFFDLLYLLNMFNILNLLYILNMLNFRLKNLIVLMLCILSYLDNGLILINKLRPFHIHNIINMYHTNISSIGLFLKIICYNTISKMLSIKQPLNRLCIRIDKHSNRSVGLFWKRIFYNPPRCCLLIYSTISIMKFSISEM